MEAVLIYVTCPSLEEARKIGRKLVEERLAACVNIFPVNSIYFWEGEVRGALEFALIIKTLEEKYEDIEKMVKDLHSYDNPCVVCLKVFKASENFVGWIRNVISEPRK